MTTAYIGMLCTGMCMGWTSPIEIILRDPETSPLGRPVTTEEMSLIGSSLILGAVIGPFIGAFGTSIMGRKYTMIVANIPMLTGWIFLIATNTVAFIYVTRILWGIACGMFITATNMYVAEIASPPVRGALLSFLQISLVLGNLLIFIVGPYTSYTFVSYFGATITVKFALILFFFPESPLYYLSKDKRDEAEQSLMKIRGKSEAGVMEELVQMQADYEDDCKRDKAKVSDLWTSVGIRKALLISCGLLAFQQLAGVTTVMFYLSSVFDAANTNLTPALSTIIVGVVQVVASSMTPLVVDRLGRRMLLLISAMGMSISLGLLGMFFYLQSNESPLVEHLSVLPLISLMSYFVVYCIGFGPIPWVVTGEVFSISIKAVALPIATVFCYTISFLLNLFYGSFAATFGMYVTFWMFALFCVLAFIFTLFLVKETKGKSLQEIQDMLHNRNTSTYMDRHAEE